MKKYCYYEKTESPYVNIVDHQRSWGGEGGQEGDKAPGVFVMKPERYCQGNGREQKEKRRQKMLRPGQYAENYVGPATRNI